MKKLLFSLFLATTIGCTAKEPLVGLSKEALPKTVMIRVHAVIEELTLTITPDGLTIEKSTQAVVFAGTGVFVSPNGHILTCAHLFNEGVIGKITALTYNEHTYPVEILYQDVKRDLALVKIEETHTPFVKLAYPRSLEVGQSVFAIGYPLGYDFSVSHGVISALNRDNIGIYNATQSDTFLNPGNSGGPLFNMKGELVGINSRIIPPVDAPVFTGLGFSVSPGQILEFLTKFKKVTASL